MSNKDDEYEREMYFADLRMESERDEYMAEKTMGYINDLEKENEKLRLIVSETLWMARRYADGRSTYAPLVVNECIGKALELGIDMSGPPEEIYASDGMLGKWNPELKMFEKE